LLFLCFFRRETSLTHHPRARSPNLVLICRLCEMTVGQNHEFSSDREEDQCECSGSYTVVSRITGLGRRDTTTSYWTGVVWCLTDMCSEWMMNYPFHCSLMYPCADTCYTQSLPSADSSCLGSSIMCTQCLQPLVTCTVHNIPVVLVWYTIIHTCHATPLPFSNSAMSFVKVRVVDGNIWTAGPTVYWVGMLLITTYMELNVVAGRSRTRAGRSHAVSGHPMLIHTCHAMPCHAMPMPCCAVALRSHFQNSMVVAWHGRSMCESNTAVLCKSNGKDTI
jgi:hypothetical protein